MTKQGRYLTFITGLRLMLTAVLSVISLSMMASDLPGGYKHLSGYPYIIYTDIDDATDFEISDSLFNQIATGVQFKVNSTDIDKQSAFYREYNEKVLPILRREHLYPKKVIIRGAASPEGPYENNRRLGMGRAQSLLKDLSQSLHISNLSASAIEGKVVNEDYAYLVDLMTAANDPDASAVAALMDSCKWNEPTCKKALQTMRGGTVWNRLSQEYFPRLRTARIVLVMGRANADKVISQAHRDTIYVRDTVYISHTKVISDTVHVLHQPSESIIYYLDKHIKKFTAKDSLMHHPLFALKTNLLFDAITALNASVEVPIGNHFSASAEVIWPWWVDSKHNQWCFEMGNVGLEGRYYFRPWKRHLTNADWYSQNNRPLQGLFLGLHADACYYDFEWKGSGKQGEAISAGITFGYQKRISRYCNLEFSLGVGAASHRYRTYEASEDEQHLWKQSTKTNRWYFGPTKAKISLVYILYKRCNDKCQKGGKL